MPSPHPSCVVAIVCLLLAPVVAAGEPGGTSPNAPATEARAGSWAHVDPQTGQRIPGRAPGVAIPPDPALSTSHAGLVERPAPGGGMMVDLQGRFRSAATGSVGSDGETHVNCHGPGAADRTE